MYEHNIIDVMSKNEINNSSVQRTLSQIRNKTQSGVSIYKVSIASISFAPFLFRFPSWESLDPTTQVRGL